MTETDIRNMLKLMEHSVISRDVEGLMSHLSEDAEIMLEMPESMGGKMELDVNSYKSMLAQSWALPAKFTYEVRNINIRMGPEGKTASASDTTLESVEINGMVISSKSEEQLTIVSDNGKPLITGIVAKVEVKF